MFSEAIKINPGLFLIFVGILYPLFSNSLKKIFLLATPLVTIILVLNLPQEGYLEISLLELKVLPFYINIYSKLFSSIFLFITFVIAFLCIQYGNKIEKSGLLIISGLIVSICFVGDLISFLLFYELILIPSLLIIWSVKTDISKEAGKRYFLIHILSGALLTSGIISHILLQGNYSFNAYEFDDNNIGMFLMLSGLLINIAAVPFSFWLSDSYPSATPVGTVILSTFSTKITLIALLVIFPGNVILTLLGVLMLCYGVIFPFLKTI